MSLATTTINVQNYGAKGNGTSDDTSAINSAISVIPPSGATLYFPCGTYKVSSGLTPISVSNVVVTGPSTNCVTLKATGSSSYVVLRMGGTGLTSSVSLASDTTSNTFTVPSGGLSELGITTGSYVLVGDQPVASHGPGSPLIANQQTVKVISVTGDTATIEGTFATTFTTEAASMVQNIVNAVTGSSIQYLTVDGSGNTGSSTEAVQLVYAANSKVAHLRISKFLGTGRSGGLLVDTGYRNSIQDVTCTESGNGGGSGVDSVLLRRETSANVQDVSITNTVSQAVFSFGLHQTHYSTIQTISVDGGSANGRPFKLLRANYNTINNATVKNGGWGHNGISVTDRSTHNTFNTCASLNNSGKGIALFGDGNVYNTFNNCTAKYNTEAAFGQFANVSGTYLDYHTTISGGTYCCQRGTPNINEVVSIFDDYFIMTGATITDDNGYALNGLVVSASHAIITNNTFSNFAPGRDIYVKSGQSASTYCGNNLQNGTTPSNLNVPCQ